MYLHDPLTERIIGCAITVHTAGRTAAEFQRRHTAIRRQTLGNLISVPLLPRCVEISKRPSPRLRASAAR
jgi:hypothetical protein